MSQPYKHIFIPVQDKKNLIDTSVVNKIDLILKNLQ